MTSFLSTALLARFSTRHPWLVLGAWIAIFAAAIVAAAGIGKVLTTDMKTYDNRDSVRAQQLIEDLVRGKKPGEEFVVVRSETATIDDGAYRSFVEGLAAELRGLDGTVASVVTLYDAGEAGLVSADRHATILPVTLSVAAEDAGDTVGPVLATVQRFDGKGGFAVLTGGDGSISRAWTELSEKDLQTAEIIGLPVAIVVLVVVFGALVAAGVPVALGLFSIVIAVGITALIGRAFELSTFVLNMITMIGLAVGIDYSLIVIQRVREERRNGLGRDEAIVRAGATATRAVLFSGLTVIVALCGLLIVPDSIYRSLAIGAVVVVVVAVAAAMTLLPAVLRLLGDRVDALRIRFPGRTTNAGGEGFWGRTTRWVTGHPMISIVASVGLLLSASVPYLAMDLGMSGVSALPAGAEPRQAFEELRRDFNVGVLSPTDIVVVDSNVRSPSVLAGVEALEATLKSDPLFGPLQETTNAAGTAMLLTVPVKADAQSDAAFEALRRLRTGYVPAAFDSSPAEVLVGGYTAQTEDYRAMIDQFTPVVFGFVLGLSFIILMVVFRSIVVPLKAIIMNLLSVGAAYGLMVLVFQEGVGNELLGFGKVERIEAWVPLFMFAVLFGLSMDYHVFLLSRIRERWEQTGDNLASVAFGVRTTAGMITGAALIMVSVFSGFAAGELVMFQQMGFGLAVAVLLDATIVRTVLVPASMALLGDLNWYLPHWLSWLPRIEIEGGDSRDVYGASPAGG